MPTSGARPRPPPWPLALVYGGGVQLLAGMWEFTRKNTFGALAFSSFGAFWISYYVFVQVRAQRDPAGRDVHRRGRLPAGLGDLHLLHDDASLRVSGAVAAVFILLTATFVLLTIGAFQTPARL